MKFLSIPCVLAVSVSAASLFGSGLSAESVSKSAPPDGLSKSDWVGIREAYENGRHAIAVNPDGTHQARNPAQTWLTRFDGHGFVVTPDAGGWSWGLELKSYGYLGHPSRLGGNPVVKVEGGKLEYQHDGNLSEWFINDSRGLEQGWTFKRRPDGFENGSSLNLEIELRGGFEAKVESGGAAVSFVDPSGSKVIHYSGLKAWDADGKTVAVRFEARETGFRVVAEDAMARYPITIDPIAQLAYLKASNSQRLDNFGVSVAVSGDTVVVGADGEDSSATGVNGNQASNSASLSGAAYVFVRSGATWIQQAYLKASNTGADDQFGISVAVSGNTIVVGAPGEDSSAQVVNGNQNNEANQGSGAAYVFARNGNTWIQQAYLKSSYSNGGYMFAADVSISGDTIAVGDAFFGRVSIFSRSGTVWGEKSVLKGPNLYSAFGSSVALSGDTLVVGDSTELSQAVGVNGVQVVDSYDKNPQIYSGAVYVFVRSGVSWIKQAFIKASNPGNGDLFGASVALSGDTIVVGASGEQSGATGVNGIQTENSTQAAGAAYVFVRSGTVWSQQAYLKASNTEINDGFGLSVAVSGDTIAVGAANEDSSATGRNGNQSNNSAGDSGAVYLFTRSESQWSQSAYLKASNTGASDNFGRALAMSGGALVIGAKNESSGAAGDDGNQLDNSAENAGAAYVFESTYALVATGDKGSISGLGDYFAGSQAMVTASPDPGYLFSNWTGDVIGSSNSLSVQMDSNKTLIATFVPDTRDPDGDGLDNYNEIVVQGTDPNIADTDEDGYSDGYEVLYSSNPKSASSYPTFTLSLVNNGMATGGSFSKSGSFAHGTNATLAATPSPGYLFESWTADASGNSTPLILLMDSNKTVGATFAPDAGDTDGDGLTNYQEIVVLGSNPEQKDTDGDGVADGIEVTDKTNPNLSDTDRDGLADGVEKKLGSNPLRKDSDGNGTADADEDNDRDGISNGREVNKLAMNPGKADTDGDGLSDTFALAWVGESRAFSPRIGDEVRFDFGKLNWSGSMRIVGTLPPGLRFDPSTQIFKGRLVGQPDFYRMTLQLFVGRSFVRSIPLPLKVAPFPGGLADSYEGLLEDRDGHPTGLVSLTVNKPEKEADASGTWTASLEMGGNSRRRTVSGLVTLAPAENASLLVLKFPAARGSEAVEATVRIESSNPLVDGSYAVGRSVKSLGKIRGFRLAGSPPGQKKDRLFTMIIDQGEQDGFSIPAGMGWATGSLSDSGEISITGQLGDAQAFKSSARLSVTGQAIVWVKPYRNTESYLGGIISVQQNNLAASDAKAAQSPGLVWFRTRDASESSYPKGFGPIQAQAGIAFHNPSATAAELSKKLGLVKRTFTHVLIEGGGLPDPKGKSVLPGSFTLSNNFDLIAVPVPGSPVVPWSGSIDQKDGSIDGVLNLPASGFGIVGGPARASGVLIPGAGFEGIVASGLVKIPVNDRPGAYRTSALVISK